jgi:hypothetical protein
MSFPMIKAVLDRSQARKTARLVLIELASLADEAAICFPTVEYLCARTGFHRTTIMRVLGELESDGLLVIERQHRHANRYRISLPEPGVFRVVESDSTADSLGSHRATPGVAQSDTGGRVERLHTIKDTVKNPSHAPAARRRFAAAKHRAGGSLRSSGPTGPKTRPSDRTEHPDPNIPDLIAVFVRLHHETLSQPYLPNWARDGACLKRAIRTWKRPDIERAMTVYFSERDARLQFGADIPAFVKRIPTLVARDRPDSSPRFVG